MKRISFLLTGLALVSLALFENCGVSVQHDESIKFYVGSSDRNLEYSIFLCEMDPGKGTFTLLDSFAGAAGPSYLALSPENKYLYAIDSHSQAEKSGYGSVTSFQVDPGSFALDYMNSRSSEGNGPCYIYCSDDGNHIFTANYSSGHIAAFPIGTDGQIQPASSVIRGSGTGPVKGRQDAPHAHQVMLDPNQHFLLATDLGSDKVQIFTFDRKTGTLTPNPAQPFFRLAPGSGPRHLAFHPDGAFVYIANELNATLTACGYDQVKGTLTEINTVSTVETSHSGSKYPAAVRVHPNGNFVYASTRGESNNNIAVFRIEDDGSASRIQVVEDIPPWPRDFNLDPSGQYLIVAGERSRKLALYAIDQKTGKLIKKDAGMQLPSPACILFL